MDCIVQRATKSRTQLSNFHFHNLWHVCMGVGVLNRFSCIRLFAILWTVSPPGSSVPGILPAGILEGVAILFSRGSSRPRDQT